MAFSSENYAKVREDFSRRRERAVEVSESRKTALYGLSPRLREIDTELSRTGVRLFGAALRGGDVDAEVARMRTENEALRAERAAILASLGYPADYTDIRYQCPVCSDTGFDGTRMCSCMRRELILAGYASSGLAELLKTQTFETFSLDYYQGTDRDNMKRNVESLSAFANGFADHMGESWLLLGATGLGKTHLSTAVAKVVLDAGFDVCCITAQDFFSVMENVHFHNADPAQEERFRTCDLLIVDDLGTELTNAFTVSCLYNVLNVRINARYSTILNTNLSAQDLRRRYDDRITSRLFGEFRPLLFSGKDVRSQKLNRS